MKDFPEMVRLQALVDQSAGIAEVKTLATIKHGDREFPIFSFSFGSKDKSAPVLGLFGGVHGLERVGTHLLLSYFEGLFAQWRWDEELPQRLANVRIVSIPLINPAGMFLGTRSNGRGVDLMRNAPVEAERRPAFWVGGQRFSARLPYFRGVEGAPMEAEAQALAEFVRTEMFPSQAALALDLHSGFGSRDRLWFPYAKTTAPFPRLAEVLALEALLDQSYPHHVYKVEPQSLNYTTHGDLWDYLFDEHRAEFGPDGRCFIPWTLEMGSWIWIKKNPAQLFSALGPFNPVKLHRLKRTMRRHLPLLDFFLRAAKNPKSWVRKKPSRP